MSAIKKVALITGGARGIGLGIAEALAKEECDIVIDDIHKESTAALALEKLRKLGTKVLYCQADVSKSEDRERLVGAIKDRFGRLNILVNNAGVAPKVRADILDATEESFERLIRINLQGPYFLTQSVAKWMIDQKANAADFSGCIINISSMSATVASPSRGDYCVSKAAVSMATKLWAVRLSEFGIGVYEIRPGIIKTEMTSTVKDKYDKLISEGLLLEPRWGLAEDIGRAAAMLVRGDLSYSTGQVLMVDGGLTVERL